MMAVIATADYETHTQWPKDRSGAHGDGDKDGGRKGSAISSPSIRTDSRQEYETTRQERQIALRDDETEENARESEAFDFVADNECPTRREEYSTVGPPSSSLSSMRDTYDDCNNNDSSRTTKTKTAVGVDFFFNSKDAAFEEDEERGRPSLSERRASRTTSEGRRGDDEERSHFTSSFSYTTEQFRRLGHSISPRYLLRRKKRVKPGPSALNERSRKEYAFVLCAGMCLAFNSGYINGACLSGLLPSTADGAEGGNSSGLKVSVSAFTGSYTNSALHLARGDVESFGFLLSMILCFMGGSFLTTLVNPRAKPYELGPQYGPTFLLGSSFMILSSIMSELRPDTRGQFYFAAAANGLQNGLSSTYSGNLIRSTHYTGISTDIGLILGQVVRGNRTSLWKLWVLLGLTISFWAGGFVSFYATSRFRTHSLVFNAIFFFLIGCGLIAFIAYINHVSLWQAAFGTWHWERALESLVSVRDAGIGHDAYFSPSRLMNQAIRESFQLQYDERNSERGGGGGGGGGDGDGGATIIPTEEYLLRLFDEIDTDRNGCICEEELYIALRAAGMKISRKAINAMMELADEDGDGLISRKEWTALVAWKIANDGVRAAAAAKTAAMSTTAATAGRGNRSAKREVARLVAGIRGKKVEAYAGDEKMGGVGKGMPFLDVERRKEDGWRTRRYWIMYAPSRKTRVMPPRAMSI